MNNKTLFLLLTAVVAVLFAEPALASDSVPWEKGMTALQKSLTGPIATGLALVGIVAAGGMLLFGGEISGFMKSIVYLVLVVSMIMCANKVLTLVGANEASGSVITTNEIVTLNSSHAILPIFVKA